jgi:hypothetical protein
MKKTALLASLLAVSGAAMAEVPSYVSTAATSAQTQVMETMSTVAPIVLVVTAAWVAFRFVKKMIKSIG